jgi:hypothetical protein
VDATPPQHSKFGDRVKTTSGDLRALFGVVGDHIATAFFPNANQFISPIAALLSFAMRPIGAAALGLKPCAGRPKQIQPA